MRGAAIALGLVLLLAAVPLARSATGARAVEFATSARDTWVIGRLEASPDDWTQTGAASWDLVVRVDAQGVAPDALLTIDVWLVRGGQSLFPYNPVLFQGPRTATLTLTALNAPPPDADVLILVATEATLTPLKVTATLNPDLPGAGTVLAKPLAAGRGAILSAYHEDAAAQATGSPRLHKNVQVTDTRTLGSGALGVQHSVTLAASRESAKTHLTYLEAYIGTATGAGDWSGQGHLGAASVEDGGNIVGTSRTGAATMATAAPAAPAAVELHATFTADAVPTLVLRGSTIPFDMAKAGIEVPRVLWSTHTNKIDAPTQGTASGPILQRTVADLGNVLDPGPLIVP